MLSIATWLKQYPSIRVISRDRAGVFAEAARLGVPQAIHVADRWHGLRNLAEHVEHVLSRHLLQARKQHPPHLREGQQLSDQLSSVSPSRTRRRHQEAHQQAREARFEQIKILESMGMTPAQQLGMKRETLLLWQQREGQRAPTLHQPSRLDPAPLVLALNFWEEGCHNISEIHRHLLAQGYQVSYWRVAEHLSQIRQADQALPPSLSLPQLAKATSLFLAAPHTLNEEHREMRDLLCHLHQDIEQVYQLT